MTWVERRWEGSPGEVGGRRARQSFTYRAFLPDAIATLRPAVSFETADLVTRAEAAIRELNAEDRVQGLEAIGALLLRSEAIASSRIEGIELSQRNLARALIDPREQGQCPRGGRERPGHGGGYRRLLGGNRPDRGKHRGDPPHLDGR